jgi:organic hydroperoxide reductase OsmC/OhrA
MRQSHRFEGGLRWTGAADEAAGKLRLERAFVVEFPGKAPIAGSSPAVFTGDDSRHNPESLLIASLMSCHLLTYLAVCERAGVRIVSYEDRACGTLAINDGKMRMVEVVLRPRVKIADESQIERALASHGKAHANCFMANSVNFEVQVEPLVSA